MDKFTRQDLQRLVKATCEPAGSLYMPTRRAGREVVQNAVRFKNLLGQLAQQLTDRAPGDQALAGRLQEAQELEGNDPWWQHQSDGLAIFLAADRFERYRVPLALDELVTIGRRFHVRPMVQLLQGDGRFYVLAVSQNQVRLLEGSRYRVDELDVKQLPKDLRSALNIDEYVTALQQHSTAKPNVAGNMTFHGHGAADMDVRKKDELLQYFRRIGQALESYLADEHTPLVFAGVEYLFPLFREACHYDAVVDQPAAGNPDELKAEALHQRAWKVVEPQFQRDRDDALRRFGDRTATKLATDELPVAVRAARRAAVDTLLLAEECRQWGVVDEQAGAVALSEPTAAGAEELLNYAAVQTILNGGRVYSLPTSGMPAGKTVLALLRFPID